MKIIRGVQKTNWVIAIYGVPGVGKSELATFAEAPILFDLENGLARINGDKTAPIFDWPTLLESFRWAFHQTEYKTIVIDTLDAVEKMLVDNILSEVNRGRDRQYYCTTLEDKLTFPFGAGYVRLKEQWAKFVEIMFQVRDSGKNIICIAHDQIEKVQNPQGENFDRYTLDIHRKSAPFVVAKFDAVFFAQWEKVFVSKQGTDSKVPMNTGERILEPIERPYCLAKNRFGLQQPYKFNTNESRKKLFQLF